MKRTRNRRYAGLTLLGSSEATFPKSPQQAQLETFPNPSASRNYWIRLECPEFTSLCPVTDQPDFAEILIDYVPDISETYRIYRRMLRTRRHWLSEAKDKVAARKIELKIEYEPDDAVPKRLWKLLEDWRCRVLANHTGNVARAAALETYFDFAASIASFPDRLPKLISRRLAAKHATEDERSSLLQLASIASAPEALPEARQQKLLQNLLANIVARGKSKIVVFCSTCEAAEAIHSLLKSRPVVRGSVFVQCATSKIRQPVLSPALRAFSQESGVHILISDQTLEEGFNLHAADAIVFYDLPWDLIRIEQRIGRTDRIARGGLQFPCYLLISLEDDDDDQLALDEAWRRVLCDEGIDVFKHPASDLQYVAPKVLSTVREAAFTGGPRALAAALPEIRRLVDEERKAIEEQDLVDGLHIPRDAATSYADRLSKADHAAREFGAALQAYIQGNLGLTAWWQENTVSFQRRRELIVPAETMLPLAPMLNRPTTVYRNIAVEQPQVEFLRPGHQAIDHCQWLLLNDMRGRAFIMWRCLPDQPDIKVIFRFIFYSEINLSPLKEAFVSMDPLAQNSLLRLIRQWFPSRADELWLELLPDGEYADLRLRRSHPCSPAPQRGQCHHVLLHPRREILQSPEIRRKIRANSKSQTQGQIHITTRLCPYRESAGTQKVGPKSAKLKRSTFGNPSFVPLTFPSRLQKPAPLRAAVAPTQSKNS